MGFAGGSVQSLVGNCFFGGGESFAHALLKHFNHSRYSFKDFLDWLNRRLAVANSYLYNAQSKRQNNMWERVMAVQTWKSC
jgi:hypothetical protein